MQTVSQNPSGRAEEETPMMQQYQSIKRMHPEAILFFRMGDFYEMFNEDAKIAARILQITLTSRNKNNPIPMCGVPHHSSSVYIARLIKAGKNVAICEQVEDPKQAKGLVKREVVRIITPGTVIDDNLLDPKDDHFLVSVYSGKNGCGLAALDISTGIFKTTELLDEDSEHQLADELAKLSPREILIPGKMSNQNGTQPDWLKHWEHCVHVAEDWTFSHSEAYRKLIEHFQTSSLEGFGCEQMPYAVSAAGALILYLHETQKSALDHVNSLVTFNVHNCMALDQATLRSLELVQSSEGSRKNSLLDLLDLSHTPMGARRIKDWILKPLVELPVISARLDLVEEFKDNLMLRQQARDILKDIYDMERLLGRISLSVCNARDLIALKNSIASFPEILQTLKSCKTSSISRFTDAWDNLADVWEIVDQKIVNDPPTGLKDGNLLKPGCDAELDRLKAISRDGKTWIAEMETRERERTGISILKVGYNKIYGYYIEITKKNLDRVPPEYIRKQSLVNAERFISPELKQYEEEITGAEEKVFALEQKLFQEIRQEVSAHGKRIQHMARFIGELDALFAFAEVAHQYNYNRPTINDGFALNFENARHPLIERIIPENQFISNDTQLDCSDNQIMIITGPNMAGKSTYLRQVALNTLMAQIGSFVPADRAEVGIVDRIFSRVGAQDHLLRGMSTFMVEMNETANILNNATVKSLIILDEIGRGTSTFDGISIAWSIVEYLHGKEAAPGPKTLFATHYHELTELSMVLTGVKNYNVQVKEWNDEIIFLRKIVPGGADKSYGIQVARLAGLPSEVLNRAREVLSNLEKSAFDEVGLPKISRHEGLEDHTPQQLVLFSDPENPLARKLGELQPDDLTPRKAMDLIYELAHLYKRFKK